MKLHFRKYGEGKPLIILHGLFGSADNWNSLVKEYSNHFCVYVIDLRNHGLSPHEEQFNYAVMSADLLEFFSSENIVRSSIIGHSMGGKVLMEFLSSNASKVDHAIIVDISPKYYPPHHQKVLEALNSVSLEEMSSRKSVEEVISPILNDMATTQFLLKNIYWLDVEEEGATKSRLAWRFNLKDISRQIDEVGKASPKSDITMNVKVLFIAGEKSNYINEEDQQLIKEYYPQSEICYIVNAGHWVQAEQPKLFYEATMKFLMSDL